MTHAVTIIQVMCQQQKQKMMSSTVSTQIYRTRSAGCIRMILMIMGDFKVRVRSGERMDYSVTGTYGFRERNDRGK